MNDRVIGPIINETAMVNFLAYWYYQIVLAIGVMGVPIPYLDVSM